MVIVVVGCLIEARNNELCDRANGYAAYRNAGQGNTIYFGLMLSYPDPLDGPSLAAAFDDGRYYIKIVCAYVITILILYWLQE